MKDTVVNKVEYDVYEMLNGLTCEKGFSAEQRIKRVPAVKIQKRMYNKNKFTASTIVIFLPLKLNILS